MKALKVFMITLLLVSVSVSIVAAERTKITFWGDWGGEGGRQFQVMVDAFNEAQDEYEAEYVVQQDMITRFLTASASGNAPDVLFWDRWRTALYAPRGVLLPIDELMKRDGVVEEDFYSEALRELSWNDNLYGLPLTVDARALFYNKTLLDEKGLEPPTTWEELRNVARELTIWDGDRLVRSGFSLNDAGLFSMFLKQTGQGMLSEDGNQTTFNNDKGLAVLNFWKQLMNEDKVYKIGFEQGLGEGQDLFVTGQVAMLYTGPWMISTYRKYGEELNFGIVPPVAGPNGDRGSMMGGFGLVIPEAAKNKEGAWAFIKWWLAEPANALLWAKTSLNIPGNLKAIQDPFFQDDPFWKPILDTLEFATIRPPFTGYSPMEVDAVIPNLQLFLEGKQDAATTLRNAQQQGDAILRRQNR